MGNPAGVCSTKVDGSGIDDAHPESGRRQRDQMFIADRGSKVDRGVEKCVGALCQHGAPSLEVPSDRLVLVDSLAVDVVMDDGGTRLETGQSVRGDL